MRTILNTVGTSLLTNAARALGVEVPGEKDLLHYLAHTAPEKASAETNAIYRLFKEGDRLVFLHSETEKGRICADILCRHYRLQKIECALEAVSDLTYKESRFKMRGLRSLVNAIVDVIRHEQRNSRDVILNATGGFKAEIAYATLIGLLFDVPVYYIHEVFRDIIEMPPIPVSWDYSLLAEHEEFFAWIDEEPRQTDEVDARLRKLPAEVRLLLVEEDGCTYLSPAGEVFFCAFRLAVDKAASVPVLMSSSAKASLKQMGAVEQRRFWRELEKLRAPVLRRSGSDQVRNCDCLVYPKGHRDERIFYFEKDGAVYVCALALHSDRTYDQLIKRGVWKKYYKDFSE